jgi:hypothetical protein
MKWEALLSANRNGRARKLVRDKKRANAMHSNRDQGGAPKTIAPEQHPKPVGLWILTFLRSLRIKRVSLILVWVPIDGLRRPIIVLVMWRGVPGHGKTLNGSRY